MAHCNLSNHTLLLQSRNAQQALQYIYWCRTRRGGKMTEIRRSLVLGGAELYDGKPFRDFGQVQILDNKFGRAGNELQFLRATEFTTNDTIFLTCPIENKCTVVENYRITCDLGFLNSNSHFVRRTKSDWLIVFNFLILNLRQLSLLTIWQRYSNKALIVWSVTSTAAFVYKFKKILNFVYKFLSSVPRQVCFSWALSNLGTRLQ